MLVSRFALGTPKRRLPVVLHPSVSALSTSSMPGPSSLRQKSRRLRTIASRYGTGDADTL
jgi:hypothetical protein